MTRKLMCLISLGLVLGSTGSVDAAGTEAFIEVDGVVVMEGENFHAADGRTDENGYEWFIDDAQDGFIGTGYADTPPPQGTNGEWNNACEITYEIDFSTSGTYSVWIRRYTVGGASNSVWVGLDGVGNGSNDNTGDANQWIWKSLGTIDVTAGLHTFNVRRRESVFKVDRIVLTTDGGNAPTDEGPPESLRGGLESAFDPNPAGDANDVGRDGRLSWTPGEFANTHDVYFGTAFNDVNDASSANPMDALVSPGQDGNNFDPGRLEFGQTYYWRVDEVNSAPDFSVFKGETWSFTVEAFSIPIIGITATASSQFGDSGPERTIDGSGLMDDLHGTAAGDMWFSGGVPATLEYAFDKAYKLHELWIWNSNQLIEAFVGFGAKDVVIEHSLDGENWTVLDGVGPLAQATGIEGYAHNNTIAFGGAMARHVRVTINTVQGIAPQASLSEVRFFYLPTFAAKPNPETGATDVAPDVTLAWGRDGREAGRHDVYVGTDSGSLPLADSAGESSFDTLALDLQLGQTYYWRVDEVNDAMEPSVWPGDVWNFTTVDAIVIDDMESYRDEEFLEIWATWVDGFEDPANGSLVGNGAAGTPETGIVQGGRQSLPMLYDNSAAAQSEATRTFDAPMDWTRHGVQGLVLYFQSSPANTGGQLYVKINDTKVAYAGDPADLMSLGWRKWYVPLSAVTGTDLSRVTSLTIGVDNGGTGVVYIDSVVLTGAARELVTPVDPGTAGLLAHYPLDGDYQDASGNGLNGAAVGTPVFENDPARGQVMRLNGLDAAVDLGASDVFNFPGSFSLSVWANITEFNSDWGHALLGKRGEDNVGWQLRRHSGTPNLTFTTRGTDGADDPQGNIDMTTAFGQWVHIAAVYDMEAGQRTVYVDGSVDVSIADGGPVAAATQNTYIGARAVSGNTGPEAFFSGSLDEVRVYGRALSVAEVASLAGRTAPFDKP